MDLALLFEAPAAVFIRINSKRYVSGIMVISTDSGIGKPNSNSGLVYCVSFMVMPLKQT